MAQRGMAPVMGCSPMGSEPSRALDQLVTQLVFRGRSTTYSQQDDG